MNSIEAWNRASFNRSVQAAIEEEADLMETFPCIGFDERCYKFFEFAGDFLAKFPVKITTHGLYPDLAYQYGDGNGVEMTILFNGTPCWGSFCCWFPDVGEEPSILLELVNPSTNEWATQFVWNSYEEVNNRIKEGVIEEIMSLFLVTGARGYDDELVEEVRGEADRQADGQIYNLPVQQDSGEMP